MVASLGRWARLDLPCAMELLVLTLVGLSHCTVKLVLANLQVRVEVPARQPAPEAAAAGAAAAAASGSAAGEGSGSGCVGSKSAVVQQQQQQASAQVAQPGSPLLMQLVDFGFVSTAATISVGGKDRRCEKSWEHATVRTAVIIVERMLKKGIVRRCEKSFGYAMVRAGPRNALRVRDACMCGVCELRGSHILREAGSAPWLVRRLCALLRG